MRLRRLQVAGDLLDLRNERLAFNDTGPAACTAMVAGKGHLTLRGIDMLYHDGDVRGIALWSRAVDRQLHHIPAVAAPRRIAPGSAREIRSPHGHRRREYRQPRCLADWLPRLRLFPARDKDASATSPTDLLLAAMVPASIFRASTITSSGPFGRAGRRARRRLRWSFIAVSHGGYPDSLGCLFPICFRRSPRGPHHG